MFRRAALLAFWLVIGLYVVHYPTGAAHTAQNIGNGLSTLADALARFTNAL